MEAKCCQCQKQLPADHLFNTGPTGIHRLLFSGVPKERTCPACAVQRLRAGERIYLKGNLPGVALPLGCASIFLIGGPAGFALGLTAQGRIRLGILIGLLVFAGLSAIQPFRVWCKPDTAAGSREPMDPRGLVGAASSQLRSGSSDEEVLKSDDLRELTLEERRLILWLARLPDPLQEEAGIR